MFPSLISCRHASVLLLYAAKSAIISAITDRVCVDSADGRCYGVAMVLLMTNELFMCNNVIKSLHARLEKQDCEVLGLSLAVFLHQLLSQQGDVALLP